MIGEGEAPVVRRRPEILYGLRNIIENAASFAGSKVLITGRWTREEIIIAVHDDGPGFSPDVLARLGEPYVSQRRQSRSPAGRKAGLGLGFFIAKTLLERSGARIAYDNLAWDAPEGPPGAFVSAVWRARDILAGAADAPVRSARLADA
jgi:two-component system sensor histidine kinase RegB